MGTVAHLDADLQGVLPSGGRDWLVAGALPGEQIEAHALASSHHRPVGWARLERQVGEPSPARREPTCPHAAPMAGRCGGCPGLHLDPRALRTIKADRVRQALRPLGLDAGDLRWASGDRGYRNRTFLVAAEASAHPRALGSWAPRSHDVVDIPHCDVVTPAIAAAAAWVRAQWLEVLAHDPDGAAALRHVQIRGSLEGQTLIEVVVRGQTAGSWPHRLERWVADGRGSSAWLGQRAADDNVLRAEKALENWGQEQITEVLLDRTWRLGPSTFFQLNTRTADAMARQVRDWAADHAVAWDLYAGVGILGEAAAQAGARAFGADVIPESVRLASTDREPGAYVQMDLQRWQRPPGWPDADLMIVNPPRKGLDAAVVETLIQPGPRTLVYMSCDLPSFVREAQRLVAEGGWQARDVQAWDMLPGTAHVELVARFVRA